MDSSERGVVVPFRGREEFGSERTQRLAIRAAGLLSRVERELAALEAEIEGDHPEPSRLARLARGEASREEARVLIRHLVTGCSQCSSVLRSLLWPERKRR